MRIISWLLSVLELLLLIYVILKYVRPYNKITELLRKFFELALKPLREAMLKSFPTLANVQFDYAIVAAFIILALLSRILSF